MINVLYLLEQCLWNHPYIQNVSDADYRIFTNNNLEVYGFINVRSLALDHGWHYC